MLVSDQSHIFISPLLYITNAVRLISDNQGFTISLIKDGEELLRTNDNVVEFDNLDLYGATLRLQATSSNKNGSISKIVIYGTSSPTSDNSYNAHIRINDEEIAESGEINVTIQDDYVNDTTVCY